MKVMYEIMHGEKITAKINTQGHCRILDKQFMPYNLYLEEDKNDIDTLVNNVTNFYYWCATSVLTLDRQFAKEILNSIGVSQVVTDRDRAMIALSYRCVSLTDIHWVREHGDTVTFRDINLYDHHLDNTFVDISLRGRQITVQNQQLAPDLSTNGCFPKAWLRTEKGFRLLKDGGADAVEREVLASKICQCFRCRQVVYTEHPLMDFNQSFRAYDTLDGARCLTARPGNLSQLEAALEAVEAIGWNQTGEIAAAWFTGREQEYEMLLRRLATLKEYLSYNTDRTPH